MFNYIIQKYNSCRRRMGDFPWARQIQSYTSNAKKHSRTQCTGDFFAARCSIGNPNVSISNVRLLKVRDFLSFNQFVKYEECEKMHVLPSDLSYENFVLFISHRWQDAANNSADESNKQFNIARDFLLQSPSGQKVSHVWLDISCITQDLTTDEGQESFAKQLDNIQTAILISDIVLVIPRVCKTEQCEPIVEFSDLFEYTNRGWCVFELVTATLAFCDIYVTLRVTDEIYNQFILLASSKLNYKNYIESPDFDALNEDLKCRGFKKRLRELDFEEKVESEISQNWLFANDPLALARRVIQILRKHGLSQEMQAYMTIAPHSKAGYEIGSILGSFTVESDRCIVLNLIASVVGFFTTGYVQVQDKLRETFQVSATNNSVLISLRNTAKVTAKDISKALKKANNPSFKRQNGIFQIQLDLCGGALAFSGNPSGFAAVSAERWATILELNLSCCELGDPGVEFLMKGQNQRILSSLITLNLSDNKISGESAVHISKFLASSKTLGHLCLSHNMIGDEGVFHLLPTIALSTVLLEVHLSSNQISDLGADYLVDCIHINSNNGKLKFLDLGLNQISFDGRKTLKECGSTKIGFSPLVTRFYEELKRKKILRHLYFLLIIGAVIAFAFGLWEVALILFAIICVLGLWKRYSVLAEIYAPRISSVLFRNSHTRLSHFQCSDK